MPARLAGSRPRRAIRASCSSPSSTAFELIEGRRRVRRNRKLWISIALAAGSVCAHAQWLNHPAPGTPRAKDGTPNLLAPAPRAANGRPDLSGVWVAEPAPLEELLKQFPDSENGTPSLGEPQASRYFGNILADFKPDDVTMQPWAEELLKQ